MENIKNGVAKLGVPRLIIMALFVLLFVIAFITKLPTASLISDSLVRTGMNGIMVLAMVPAILSGTGPNFGLPIGIISGLLAVVITIQIRNSNPEITGILGFFVAILISLPIAIISGYIYGKLLNAVKGSEMTIATYVGFSIVSIMCIVWLILPFSSPNMVWPIGKGLRVTISLEGIFDKILNNFLSFKIGNVTIPTGLILFFLFFCFLMWLFFRSKTGLSIKASGDNPRFAEASGMNVNRNRIIGTVISTVLGAIGIIAYAQSYGFLQLYQAPLMMAFPAVAAVLIGGASAQKAKISHVILGTFLFQGLLTVALPVASKLAPEGNLSEVARAIIQNGIILYALTKVGGGDE